MKTIVITGQSGSGKSYLSKKLSKSFDNSIIIKTDSYYRDNIFIKFLSIFLYDIYDRPISIMLNKINMTLRNIKKKAKLITSYEYDFIKKHSSQSRIEINYNGTNQFLIVEGIFAHRLDINYQKTINILCDEEKEICYKRRLKRDKLDRGRDSIEVNKKFNRSWYLFNNNITNYLKNNKVIHIKPIDKDSYNKLVNNLKNN